MGTDNIADGYVRIQEGQLARLRLEHLTSAIDMSISLPEELEGATVVVTGYTEWFAPWQGMQISVGWDWAYVNDRILMIHADEIRSNVRLIDDDGDPTSPARTGAALAMWVETLPWRDGPVRGLVQHSQFPPQ